MIDAFIIDCSLTFFQMVAEFPVLDSYKNLWPLDILLISLLKYTSAASKGSVTQKAVEVITNNGISRCHQG
jgi:hypothetical protein